MVKIPDTFEQLEITIQKITVEKEKYYKRAVFYEKTNAVAILFTSIFASATPALVAYQASANNDFWKIFTIILISIAGSLTTLQSGFKLNEKRVRYKITELKLSELESDIIIKRSNLLNSGSDKIEQYYNIRKLNEIANKDLSIIFKDHFQGEVSIINQPSKSIDGNNDENKQQKQY